MVNLYFECRAQNRYPYDGSWGQQTAYCTELFEFIDEIRYHTEKKKLESANKPTNPVKR